VLAVLGVGLAAWVALGALVEWAERVRLFRAPPGETWRRARHLPRAAYGMTVAHLGLAVAVAGIAASAWQSERIETLHAGESLSLAGMTIRLDSVRPVEGPNYAAQEGSFTVSEDGRVLAELHPEKRFFPLQGMSTSKTAIHTNLLADLYLALGDGDAKQGWTVRAYWKPLVPWIWLGAIIMAAGGLLSLSDRRFRVGVAARRATPVAPSGAAEA
jgi:cytochrome c-type biogenesis protein CcmF